MVGRNPKNRYHPGSSGTWPKPWGGFKKKIVTWNQRVKTLVTLHERVISSGHLEEPGSTIWGSWKINVSNLRIHPQPTRKIIFQFTIFQVLSYPNAPKRDWNIYMSHTYDKCRDQLFQSFRLIFGGVPLMVFLEKFLETSTLPQTTTWRSLGHRACLEFFGWKPRRGRMWNVCMYVYIYIPGTLNNQFFMDVWPTRTTSLPLVALSCEKGIFAYIDIDDMRYSLYIFIFWIYTSSIYNYIYTYMQIVKNTSSTNVSLVLLLPKSTATSLPQKPILNTEICIEKVQKYHQDPVMKNNQLFHGK